MKRSRKPPAARKVEPSPDQIRHHIQCLSDEHQVTWQTELKSAAPHWVYLLNLHLRMVELEHLEDAVQEFL